jgi:hypothetical protein
MPHPGHKLNVCGQNIKRVRLSRSPMLTQEQLVTSLQVLGWDIDRFGISKIERGQRQVTDIELLHFTKVLGVSASELLDDVYR